ncbi:MAG: CDP-alcohol phosphatidyltransferase family protein [Proteobacteria bacterium]|nr:CDP-alcohol phosphatidyltransferase family protein [Pseudomonadota bacterium]MDA1301249.1 CDP-alcohol phosphatidyltransferase family protein [Pseudomonadota bacterium]
MQHLPNLLSIARFFLAIPMGYLIWYGHWGPAATVLWLAIGTDLADGHLARRLGAETSLGGLLDHSSDAVFVTVALCALAFHGLVPAILPVLVILAFMQYMADSRALAGKPLRTSALGRYNGICYFILAGFPVMEQALNLYPVPLAYFPWLGWGLVLSTGISMIDRLITLLQARHDAME